MVSKLVRKGIFIEGAEAGHSEALEKVMDILESYRCYFGDKETFEEMVREVKELA